jgi:hypothetical protein
LPDKSRIPFSKCICICFCKRRGSIFLAFFEK